MARYTAYHLAFRSPLHVGERGVGLEVARTHLPADTLFSAVCSVWRLFSGEDSLCLDFLRKYDGTGPDGARTDNRVPMLLSSAFPFAGQVRFFPKPLGQLGKVGTGDEHFKAYKRLRFVSERIFQAILHGTDLVFRRDQCVNGGTAWVTDEERALLEPWTDDATGDIALWKVAVVPRVTLDRITSASEIWHFGELTFADGAGLWFAAEFAPDAGEELRNRFETVLRVLGDEGLGGDRTAGRGLFMLQTPQSIVLPAVGASGRFVTFAPLCPRDAQELAALTVDGAAYELMPRRGWATSPEASHLRRKTVWMFAEGSVLTRTAPTSPGCLVDLTPDILTSHPVLRYGYGFPVGLEF